VRARDQELYSHLYITAVSGEYEIRISGGNLRTIQGYKSQLISVFSRISGLPESKISVSFTQDGGVVVIDFKYFGTQDQIDVINQGGFATKLNNAIYEVLKITSPAPDHHRCVCPMGRRELLPNPAGLQCTVEGYILAPESIGHRCPDGSVLQCPNGPWICKNSGGHTMPAVKTRCYNSPGYVWCAKVGKCLPPGSKCTDSHSGSGGKSSSSSSGSDSDSHDKDSDSDDDDDKHSSSDDDDHDDDAASTMYSVLPRFSNAFQRLVILALAVIGVMSLLHLGFRFATSTKYAAIPAAEEV